MGKHLLRKFFLLMWKNWALHRRNPWQTAMEILAPVILGMVLVIVRSFAEPKPNPEVYFNPYPPVLNGTYMTTVLPLSAISELLLKYSGEKEIPAPTRNWHIAWSPQCAELQEIMDRAVQIMSESAPSVTLLGVGYPNSDAMDNILTDPLAAEGRITFAGIAFEDDVCKNDKINKDRLQMTIRFPSELRKPGHSDVLSENWHTDEIFPLFQTLGPREERSDIGMNPGYWYQGFLGVQHAIYSAILAQNIGEDASSAPFIMLQRFPYPEYVSDTMLQAMQHLVPVVFMLGFIYSCFATVKSINVEKELQIKETMKIMGLPGWLHWSAWFITKFLFLMTSVSLLVMMLKVPWYPRTSFSVFTFTSWSVLFVFLMIYMVATICFDFMVSVLFSKATSAALFAGVFWFLQFSPFLFLAESYGSLELYSKLVPSVFSNTAMAFGFTAILAFEGTGKGAQWDTLFQPAVSGDNLVLGYIWIMLLFDSAIYVLFALYFEAVFPGKYGVPKPWYFPFQPSFWCGSLKRASQTDEVRIIRTKPDDVHEVEPNDLKAGIQILHLRKVYHEKAAVKDLVLNMYEGQITVLLGHNGAGKTTTLSMLMGMITPTSGTALLGGYDIRTQMDEVRASLGICPQHNILFNELTVYEHLYFYGKLKGLTGAELKDDIDKYIELLELEPKRNSQARTLSGGMKRKLSCGIALCGGSKVVMLDEPTSGMDPAARRALWDVIRLEKADRTMLLTTHFMDEADLLGDRIAIISDGVLQCCGSPFFLKKRYGAGYHLIIVKEPDCDVNAITNLLKQYIPDITEDQDIGSELSYVLDEEKSDVFEKMLSDLERNKDRLHIESYGVSLTTMEEVFLKAGKEAAVLKQEQSAVDIRPSRASMDNSEGVNTDISKSTVSYSSRLTGTKLIPYQFQAMFKKKMIYEIRTWYLTLCQMIIPALILTIGILAARSKGGGENLPPLEIDLKNYESPRTLVEVGDLTMRELANIYTDKTSGEEINGDMSKYIIRKSIENLGDVRDNYIVGATFKSNTIICWYNNLPYHSAPLALNLAHNAVLAKYTNHTIQIVNHPLPYTPESKVIIEGNIHGVGFQIAFQMGFGMALVAAFYVIFPIKERSCKSKHQQFVSGVNVLIFWISTFLWDFLIFMLPILGALIDLYAFQQDGFKTTDELGRVFLILLFFVWAVLPYHYLLSFAFNVSTTGLVAVSMINLITGVAAFMVVLTVRILGFETKEVSNTMDWIFTIAPHYSLTTSLLNLHNNYIFNSLCAEVDKIGVDAVCQLLKNPCCRVPSQCPEQMCWDRYDNYITWNHPGIARNLSFLAAEGVVFSILLLLVEYNIFHKCVYSRKKGRCLFGKDDEELDSDVAHEREMILMTPLRDLRNQHTVVLKEVSKFYGNFLAVKQLSIAIRRGECFGLLGVNGAGKTTTFKMMTGDETITCGKGYIYGLNLKTSMKQVHRQIGYCPQFDALLGNMTGRETMYMFCLLRGVPRKNINNIIDQLSKDLVFQKHIDKKVEVYSGGNKRKLSTAIALIGDPSVVFLDEPTSGMDPAARRHLWNVICQVRDSGKSIILTSHSMDECEALCTRLAIMVNGRLRCLGPVQHLKNKYAKGCTLIVKVGKTFLPASSRSQIISKSQFAMSKSQIALLAKEYYDVDPVKEFVVSTFPGAELKEEYHGMLKYYIEYPTERWSRMFGILEENKRHLNIEDYSLGQASLEQVFLTFTKHQEM